VPEQSKSEPLSVLVVVDDDAAGTLLHRLIGEQGWDAHLTHDAGGAIVELEQAHPPYAAVVLDLDIASGTSSVKALADIRRIPGDVARVPVVVCSWSDDDRPKAWMSGADGHLVRPFHASVLHTALVDAIERPDSQREDHRKRQLGSPAPPAPG